MIYDPKRQLPHTTKTQRFHNVTAHLRSLVRLSWILKELSVAYVCELSNKHYSFLPKSCLQRRKATPLFCFPLLSSYCSKLLAPAYLINVFNSSGPVNAEMAKALAETG